MRWIAGFRTTNGSDRLRSRPRNARTIGENIWSSGHNDASIRSIAIGTASLHIAGLCLASNVELRTSLTTALQRDWSALMSWPGAYTAVIQTPGQTVAIGSLSGTTNVYYTKLIDGYLWSDAATPLAAHIGSQVNLYSLVTDMAVGYVDVNEGETAYRNVLVVPPGSYLKIDNDSISVRRWYEPRTTTCFDETVSGLQSQLRNAMARREAHSSTMSSDLSGGFDSSSLAILASRQHPITGLTYIDPWINNDDLSFATEIARATPNIDHHLIEGGVELLHYSGLDDLSNVPQTDLPTDDLDVLARDRKLLSFAAERGSNHHLNGEGGDGLFDGARTHLADQFSSGQRRAALRAAMAFARRTQTSPLKMMAAVARLANTTQRQAYREVAAQLQSASTVQDEVTYYDTMRWCLPAPSASWLSQDVLTFVTESLESVAATSTHNSPGQYHDWLEMRLCARNTASVRSVAEEYGLTLDMPYLDAALMDTCLSLTGHKRTSLTRFKPLLTAALPELPDILRQRTTKGSFDATVSEGFRRNAQWFRNVVSSSQLIQAGLIRADLVSEQLERAIAGLEAATTPIQQLVTRELWLATRDLRFSTWWEVNEIA